MKKRSGIFACAGAVVGAGFASGREMMAFFTRYGKHAWWLILLAAGVFGMLCLLCLRQASRCHGQKHWLQIFTGIQPWRKRMARLCSALLLCLTAGAMVSATGHMTALLWPHTWAYSIGAVGTLVAVWLMGFVSLRPLNGLGGLLTALLILSLMAALLWRSEEAEVLFWPQWTAVELVEAALRVIAYTAMNLTLAIGVVCRAAGTTRGEQLRTAIGFSVVMLTLMLLSHKVYSGHPGLTDAPFPMVVLLSAYGRGGFVLSVILMGLSAVTTLAAVICAFREMVECHVHSPVLQAVVTLGIPLAVSNAGFSGIVDSIYAPAGLICLLTVFVPMIVQETGKKKLILDNQQRIQ